MLSTIRISEVEAQEEGRRLVNLVRGDKRARRNVIAKRRVIRDLYFGENNRPVDYAGQSNIHFHVMTEKIEGLVPKIVNAFWNADPIVHVQRVAEEHNQDETDNNQIFLNWSVENDIVDFYATFEQWVRNAYLDGVAVLKPYYCRRTRNTVVVETVKRFLRKGEPDFAGQLVTENRLKDDLEILVEIFGVPAEFSDFAPNSLVDYEKVKDNVYIVSFADDRIIYEDIRVEFHENEHYDEIDVCVFRPVTVHDSPMVDLLEFEDFILPFRSSCPQTAERATHQYWLSPDEIQYRINNEDWDITEEEFERLVARSRGEPFEDDYAADDNDELKRQKDRHVGESDYEQPLVDSEGKLLIYEIYTCADVNGDGELEEVVYQIPVCLEKVVKIHYLEELFPHGRRPFIDLHNIRISNRWYSLSFGELLAPINIEVNAIINMVNEAQELINNPFFFYVPAAATIDPNILLNIEPGMGIPVADINSIFFPKFSQEPLANLATIDFLLMFADRLTIVPQSMGSSQVRNAPRTARGTLALLSEAGIKTDIFIISAQRGAWKELIHQIHALYAHFGPDEKYFYVTGKFRPKRITNKELRGRFEYRFTGNTINTNREVMRTISQQRYMAMAAEPLFSMDLNARRNLVEDFLRHFSEGTDIDKLLPQLPGQGGTHPPMPQQAEIQVMRTGVFVEPLPLDNHVEHLQVLQQFRSSKEFAALDPVTVSLIAIHERTHLQLAQQQIAQGSVPMGGTEANNLPTGTDMGDMEGGIQ